MQFPSRSEPKLLRNAEQAARGSAGRRHVGTHFFKFAEEKLKNVEIICYEKNHDAGGTWLENRYLDALATFQVLSTSFLGGLRPGRNTTPSHPRSGSTSRWWSRRISLLRSM